MDYEKKYKEALNWMRIIYPTLAGSDKEDAEHYFPELAESEDERIRKWVFNLVDNMSYENLTASEATKNEEWKRKVLAYLEKQREKPADAKSERVIKAARRVLNNWLYGDISADVSGDLTELEDSIREYDGEEKQKEREPAQSEDERIREALIEVLHRLPSSAFEDGAEGGCIGATKEQMLSYLEKQKSKDDEEEYLDGIKRDWFERGKKEVLTVPELYGLEKQKEQEHICDSAQYEGGFKTGLEIGLRKQKECLADDSKTLESEDEKMIDEIINTVTGYHPIHSTMEINEMVAWLKKQKGLFKDGVGHYFYDGDKVHFCSAPAMEVRELDDSNEPIEHWQYVGEVDLEKDKAIEILEDYLKWAVSESEEDCSYTWNELANAIRLGIDAMKEKKPNIELIQKSWYMEGYHDCEFGYEPRWIIKTGEGGPRYEENPKYGQMLEAEQKPVEYLDKDKVYAIMKKLVKLAAFSQLIPINSEEYKMIDEITCDIHKLLDYPIEQKPAEKQDYSGLNELEQAIHRGFLCAGVKNVPVNIIKETAQDCLAQLKPAEWSEEDEQGFGNTLWAINQAHGIAKDVSAMGTCSSAENWVKKRIKSLRPSWKPSEDEERLINTSISFLKDFADKGYENAVECIDWLKSKLNGNTGK